MNCFFCNEAAIGHLPPSVDVGLPSRILSETENFLVIVDISPLTLGHLLIIPRDHYLSFGAVPRRQRSECDALTTETLDILTRVYSPPVIMEHGSSNCSQGGACVAHAHLQIVPCNTDMLSAMQQFNPRALPDFWNVAECAAHDKPYLFLRDQQGAMYLSEDISTIERQFIRKEIGVRIGIPSPAWDWRLHKRFDLLRETYHALLGRWRDARL